jgi:hypothetical protein
MEAYRNESTGRWTLEGVEPSEKTFDTICQKLRDKENFKFARYGDGEFLCMSGKVGKNCDGHEYFPELGMALNDAFYSDPEYMVGIQPLSVHGGLYQRAIKDQPGPKNIYDADVLHSASIDGRLELLFDVLQIRDVLLVGAEHMIDFALNDQNRWWPILIPSKNCWRMYEQTIYQIKLDLSHNSVVLLCASMMSEVIINHLKDCDCTIIDCGSVFDPYAGKLSRSYHHKLKLNGY